MILVWDTCALNVVCRAIAFHLTVTSSPLIAPATRGEEFLQIFQTIMVELGTRCGCSSRTSEVLFAIEIDLAAPDSMLRDQDDLVESFCTQGTFKDDWESILENTIVAVPVSEEEIEILRRTIQPDPGHRDVSLIVAALNLSTQTGQDCVIVTDDISLSDRINELRSSSKQVFLNGQSHSTTRLSVKLSLQILRDLYVACGIDHDLWSATLHSYKDHYNGHFGQAGQKHCQDVADFYMQYHTDRAEKERGCMAAEQGFDFEVDNA